MRVVILLRASTTQESWGQFFDQQGVAATELRLWWLGCLLRCVWCFLLLFGQASQVAFQGHFAPVFYSWGGFGRSSRREGFAQFVLGSSCLRLAESGAVLLG